MSDEVSRSSSIVYELSPADLATDAGETEPSEPEPEPEPAPSSAAKRDAQAADSRTKRDPAPRRIVWRPPSFSRARISRTLLLRVISAVVLGALVTVSVLLVLTWRENGRLSEQARQRRELAASASEVTRVFFNWDYQHMQQSFDAKYPLLTKAAADAIRPTAATLTSYFTSNKASSTASITGVYPGEKKGQDASVMVVINTRVTTTKSIQSNQGAAVSLTMKRVAGAWLASNITLLGSGAETVTDPKGKPLPANKDSALPGAVPTPR
ncbi:hypothetical protein J4573_11320 [Actinomadura barringtoniae]|uniref:Mce-associated membrane protein n=1 Tax=Actinomadura barringtoniae TaxID=1427535 RepID=A0A939P8E3_9ACTN|nr:hypothetical protein [Actinomadura barringtoniae]MBO2447680.1 hypothetical protein [Actinomadura barringtoniae]